MEQPYREKLWEGFITVNLGNRIYRVNTRTHKKIVFGKRVTYQRRVKG